MANENVISRKVTTIKLRDDKDYYVRPLTLNESLKVWPLIQKLEKAKDTMDAAMIQSMIDIVYIALQKKVDKDKIGDLVDLADIKIIISAIVGNV